MLLTATLITVISSTSAFAASSLEATGLPKPNVTQQQKNECEKATAEKKKRL